MTDWLIIGILVATFWLFWLLANYVIDLFEIWNAARRGEELSANKERERS